MNPFCLLLLLPLLFLGCNNSVKENGRSDKMPQAVRCYSPQTSDKDWYTSGTRAPKFAGLGGVDFKISASHKEVQEYFNQGLMLAYGFNHAEAARSFYEATRLDSTCAMAYWGFAYVLGPNYNGGMEEDHFQWAYDAAMKAKALAVNCTPTEVALIEALTKRYAARPPADRSPLDMAYAVAMKKVYDQYPSDPDIGALYAESMMNLHPWDLYDKSTKAPKPWTPELLAVLEHLMEKHPKHPGAHHFYIHALEASATPERALPSAKLLETLVPGSGHLVHMPSHIYINTGDYHLGSLVNLRAIEIDSLYTTACHAQGVYPLAYYPHNYHFLAATATLEGNSKLARKAATELQRHTAKDIMRMPGWGTLQHYYTIPYHVAVKFATWDSILSITAPEQDLVYPRAIWHYARGMAFLGKGKLPDAARQLDSLRFLAADTSLQNLTVWDINTAANLVHIAVNVLSAGIGVQQHELGKAESLLKEAVAMEDNLNYNEPPDWFFSVRHHLGAVLLKAGKYEEATNVYRDDLKIWRKNGWALIGLYNSLVKLEQTAEAADVKAAFDESWQYADLHLVSSSSIME